MEYNIKVLIADENAEERKKLRGALAAANIFSVDEVSNGEEALKRLQGGGYTAAVIDLWLSGIDGIGIIRKLRTPEPSARGTYLIVTSGTKGNGVLFEAASAGADMEFPAKYISGPLRPTVLYILPLTNSIAARAPR